MTPKEFLIREGKTPEEADELLEKAAGGPSQAEHDKVALKDADLAVTMSLQQWSAVMDALEGWSKMYADVEHVTMNPRHMEAEDILRRALAGDK